MAKVGYNAEVKIGLSFEGEANTLPSANEVQEALKIRLDEWAAEQRDIEILIANVDVV